MEDQNKKSIKNWLSDDRPREKLIEKGRQSLSSAELIAILIGSGSRNKSAVELSQEILQSVDGNWNELAKLGIKDLIKFKGIGEAKAISIITAIEIGRRKSAQTVDEKPLIHSSKAAFSCLQPFLSDLHVEEFWVLLLNKANRVIKTVQISRGGISQTTVDKRVIFKLMLEENATGLILSHNHPSGNLKPSKADIKLTNNIEEGCEIMGFSLLDHIIIGQSSYFSFKDERVL